MYNRIFNLFQRKIFLEHFVSWLFFGYEIKISGNYLKTEKRPKAHEYGFWGVLGAAEHESDGQNRVNSGVGGIKRQNTIIQEKKNEIWVVLRFSAFKITFYCEYRIRIEENHDKT